jgi:hypothetical protein
MSPSDLKQVEAPLWIEQGRGKPTLMLFSVVDDCSGWSIRNIAASMARTPSPRCVSCSTPSPPPEPELPFQGLPVTIYMDNGPVSRSRVFQSVMGSLGIRVLTHLPPKQDDRHTAARAKGKVERPFRTVKEVHETLYHFHKPKDEAEANLWMRRALVTYNNGGHRAEPHARIEHWLRHLPGEGACHVLVGTVLRLAREPERRTVAGDATVSVEGVSYEVEPELAGETVTLLWGLSTSSCSWSTAASDTDLRAVARRSAALPIPQVPEEPRRGAARQGGPASRSTRSAPCDRDGGDRPLPSLPPPQRGSRCDKRLSRNRLSRRRTPPDSRHATPSSTSCGDRSARCPKQTGPSSTRCWVKRSTRPSSPAASTSGSR